MRSLTTRDLINIGIFTVLYFGYFVALALIGIFERPQPLPASIADSVLENIKSGSGARLGAATASEPNAKG